MRIDGIFFDELSLMGRETADTQMSFEKANLGRIPLNGDSCVKAFSEARVRLKNEIDTLGKRAPAFPPFVIKKGP